MSKFISLVFGILIITAHQRSCIAFKFLGNSACVISLGQFLQAMYEKAMESPKNMDATLNEVRIMNSAIQENLSEIMKVLKKLPSIIYYTTKRMNLETYLRKLGAEFERVLIKAINLNNGVIGTEIEYKYFADHLRIEQNYDEIRGIITDQHTMRDLVEDFTTNVQVYESVCETQMSHLQLLENLLNTLKVAMTQYFIAQTAVYDMLDSHSSEKQFNQSRNELAEKLNRDYKYSAELFNNIMVNASREVFTCNLDYRDGDRYQNKQDSPYVELLAFQKYFMNQMDAGNFYRTKSCPEIKKVQCYSPFGVCQYARSCSNDLIECDTLQDSREESYYICPNKNRSAIARYSTVVYKNKNDLADFYCNTEMKKQGFYSYPRFNHYAGTNADTGNSCRCICPENTYFISTRHVYSNIAENKVVTGVKFTMVENTLYIQLQEGKLSANGTIEKDTITWQEIKKDHAARVELSWTDMREFALTEKILPLEQVIVGLGFKNSGGRMLLVITAAPFKFLTGEISPVHFKLVAPEPHSELDLSDLDVPTKSNFTNFPDSHADQYLKFTTSSETNDGGQTTIPFIDTQELATKPPVPLAGVGVIHKGQKGFGGFLAFKIYTYDSYKHFEKEEGLKKTLLNFQKQYSLI